MKNLSGTADYSALIKSPKKSTSTPIVEEVKVLLSEKDLLELTEDYKALLEKCEKLYNIKTIKQLNDIKITLHSLDKSFKVLFEYSDKN